MNLMLLVSYLSSTVQCESWRLTGRLASSCAPGYYSHEQQQPEVHKQQ